MINNASYQNNMQLVGLTHGVIIHGMAYPLS